MKRLHVEHARAKTEFENEVKLISNVHHRNLLRLLGWSTEGSNLLLVLEYIPNGRTNSYGVSWSFKTIDVYMIMHIKIFILKPLVC